jgi:hypothetical protein
VAKMENYERISYGWTSLEHDKEMREWLYIEWEKSWASWVVLSVVSAYKLQ